MSVAILTLRHTSWTQCTIQKLKSIPPDSESRKYKVRYLILWRTRVSATMTSVHGTYKPQHLTDKKMAGTKVSREACAWRARGRRERRGACICTINRSCEQRAIGLDIGVGCRTSHVSSVSSSAALDYSISSRLPRLHPPTLHLYLPRVHRHR